MNHYTVNTVTLPNVSFPNIELTWIKEKFSFWKNLTRAQKFTLVALLFLLFVLPIATLIVLQPTRPFSQASLPITPPIPTPPPSGFGNAIQFLNEDFNNSYAMATPEATATAILSQNPFTIEAWVNLPKPSSGNYIRDYSLLTYTKPQAPTDYGYIFRLSLEVQETSGIYRPMFSALIANSYNSSVNSNYISVSPETTSLQPDTWNHIAVVSYSENNTCTLKLYLNGVLSGSSQQYHENCQISTQQPQELLIAKPPQGLGGISGYYYHGQIDELRVSKKVRYFKNFTPPTRPFRALDKETILLYHFNENTGASSTSDSSSSQMDAQLIGPHIEFVKSTIPVANRPPLARFFARPRVGYSPLRVRFINRSRDPDKDELDYFWDFGDGSTSTKKNPTHTYVLHGLKELIRGRAFTVTLTVTDEQGARRKASTKIFVRGRRIFPRR